MTDHASSTQGSPSKNSTTFSSLSPSPKCDLAERTTVLDLNGNYLSVWLQLPLLASLSLKNETEM